MTSRKNKLKNCSNKEEAYKLGRRTGFGDNLRLTIAYLRKTGIAEEHEEPLKDFVLKRKDNIVSEKLRVKVKKNE